MLSGNDKAARSVEQNKLKPIAGCIAVSTKSFTFIKVSYEEGYFVPHRFSIVRRIGGIGTELRGVGTIV